MRIDFGLVLCIVLEYIFFICYADTLFYKKHSSAFCLVAVAIGYIINGFTCIFGNILINTLYFFLMNTVALAVCYHTSNKNALFQGALLTVISTGGELAIASIGKLGINLNDTVSMLPLQSFILTVASKLLYLVGLMILTHIFKRNKKSSDVYSAIMIIIPVLTMIILLLMINVNTEDYVYISICVILIIIDLIVFILNQTIITKNVENEILKLHANKEERDFREYERLSMLHHDMKEHLDTIASLMENDNKEAKDYLKSIYSEAVTESIINYTDNEILNIVLSRKIDECEKQGIRFILNPVQASLKFFQDKDIVSIFSNLINNATESCRNSSEKKIFMDIYAANENFVVIKIENSCDKKPLVIDGRLKTHKDNERFHGIGMSSIQMALKKYNGTLIWSYDEENKIFRTTITINTLMTANHSVDLFATRSKKSLLCTHFLI